MAMNWKAWYSAFDIYATAAGISNKPEKVQCCIFLHVAGAEAQKVYRTLEFEDDRKDKLEPLVAAFREYCEGKTNLTITRYQFNSFNQTTEHMDEYIRELQNKITYCDYGPVEKSILCDRLICGVKNNRLRDKLLQTANISLTECMEMCRLSEHRAAQLNNNGQIPGEEHVDLIGSRPTNAWGAAPAAAAGAARPATWDRRPANKSWAANRNQCNKCGYTHQRGACPAYGKQCTNCKRTGHFYKMCTRRRNNMAPINEINLDDNNKPPQWFEENAAMDELFIGSISDNNQEFSKLWYSKICLGTTQVHFKLDTGSEANIIPLKVFSKLDHQVLRPSKCKLITYSGQCIVPKGEATILVNGRRLRFQVTESGSPILGKSACVELKLIARVGEVNQDVQHQEDSGAQAAEKLVNEYIDVFSGLGTIKVGAKIHIDENVNPTIDPPRRIPHAIIDKVKLELDKMLDLGVIVEQIEPTPWVSSITIVKKPDKIRICLDPTKLNKAIKRSQYPTKTIEEVVAHTSGAKYFSVIDANCGYWQIELDDESSRLCTFNTPWGRYRYTRLPFGIKTAGDIFINEMDKILYGLPGVNVITDDILIYGNTINEHNIRLRSVLEKARKVNLKFNPKKSKICKTEVTYVGHQLTQDGVKPSMEHVKAITEMPTPTDKSAVQRFLGMIGYVGKFIPNLSETAKPLRILLNKDTMWHWQFEQNAAFENLKKLLITAPVLKYYNVNEPITIQVDASKSGLGAAIIQCKRPVAMASKALDNTQANYAVIEKELLAICFGCKKFHNYIFGKEVTIETDHKPLVSIMTKPLHQLSARMQRMRMRLQNYNLNVTYIKGSEMYIADTLSRAHSNSTEPSELFDKELSIASIGISQHMLHRIQEETKKDETLMCLIQQCKIGWPDNINDVKNCIKPYTTYKNEITTTDNLVLKQNRIIIPKSLQREMLHRLHETHQGVVKTKQLAKEYMHWPGMAQQIEDKINRCDLCQQFRNAQHNEPMISHKIPNTPYDKLGVDLFEINNKHFILVIDYYSKFPEITELNQTSSKHIIKALKEIFCRHGIPSTVVSDNGPQFASTEYRQFAKEFDFDPIFTNPYHPQSNGQAERYVQTIKTMIKKAILENKDYNVSLLNYRNTPIQSLEASPAQLLMSRRLRSKLPTLKKSLKPTLHINKSSRIIQRQNTQAKYYNLRAGKHFPPLKIDDQIKYKQHDNKWKSGKITKTNNPGSRDYEITNYLNHKLRRNRIHIFKSHATENKCSSDNTQTPDTQNNGQTLFEPEDITNYVTRYGRTVQPVQRYGYENT